MNFSESGTSAARFSGRCLLSTSPSVPFVEVQQLHLEYHGNWSYAVVVTWQKPRSLRSQVDGIDMILIFDEKKMG